MERDFDQIATEDLLARAGVSRGGMYHHFESKLEVFKAAYVASEQAAMVRLAIAAQEQIGPDAGPFEFLRAGSLAYVRECATDSEMVRIGLRQSRTVLGWEGWREAAQTLGIAVIRAGIQAAVDAGELQSEDVAITTHLVLAALIEAGLLVATDPNPDEALSRIEPEITRLLERLRPR